MTQTASAESWSVTVAIAETEADELCVMRRLVEEQKADGFILPRTFRRDPRIALKRHLGVPFILYGRTDDDADCAWYDIQGEDAMRAATMRPAALGHRRIGHIPGGAAYTYARLRIEGYRAGLQACGLSCDPTLIGAPALSGAEGAAATKHSERSRGTENQGT